MYEYNARLVRVIDGDTCVLDTDLGFDVHHITTVRLGMIDCPEISTPMGIAAAAFAAEWFRLTEHQVILWTTERQAQSFNRWIGNVQARHETPGVLPDLAHALRMAGHFKIVEHLG